ncbi:choice-of-anchor K domain-containing protein [uncultured Sphingomonas sp.]|uniref:choice-of-anchor K domain-containing protein n=1 Tax=uncultured Sphingomonas sp. TaxID=158754 RepID=UPI0030F9F672
MIIKHIALAAVVALAPVPALAADVSGTTQAVFQNPAPASAVTTGVGTNSITWGVASDNVGVNKLRFDAGTFSSVYNSPFKVGRLTYFNGTVQSGTEMNAVDLALDLTFANPNIGKFSNVFSFGINNTLNNGTADENADYLSLPTSFSAGTFVADGITYGVKLTGFGNITGDGFVTQSATEFRVREGGSASADLFAMVTPAVPEPATWAMMLTGFGVVGMAMRRRKVRYTTQIA